LHRATRQLARQELLLDQLRDLELLLARSRSAASAATS
jgi:hypothetical protein